jgi:hypothetical protein
MLNLKVIFLLVILNISYCLGMWCRCQGSISGDSTEYCCNKIGGSWVTYSWKHMRGACDSGSSTGAFQQCCRPKDDECY